MDVCKKIEISAMKIRCGRAERDSRSSVTEMSAAKLGMKQANTAEFSATETKVVKLRWVDQTMALPSTMRSHLNQKL